MRWIVLSGTVALATIVTPLSATAQSASAFGAGEVEITVEQTAKESGDGSGEYSLTTIVRDDRHGVEIVHELTKVRTVMMEIERDEWMVVKENGAEIATAGSDPAALGPWRDLAIDWVIPFAVEWDPERMKNYRPRETEVREAVQAAVPDTSVRTRATSDGRTTASVSVDGTVPVDRLAEMIVEIRDELEDADIALATLRISATATAPEGDSDVRGDSAGTP